MLKSVYVLITGDRHLTDWLIAAGRAHPRFGSLYRGYNLSTFTVPLRCR
jgi:hypothetical protein